MGLLAIAAIGGPALVGLDPAKQSLLHTLESPSLAHPLGTDNLGRDMAARLLSGAQLSLSLAFLSVITAGLPGTLLGVAAAWFGGWPDRLLGAFADAVLALPGLLLVLMLAAISPGSWWALYAGISLTLWVEYFRYTRQRARIVLAEPSVEASKLLGLGPWLLIQRHLLPEIGPGLLTIAAFGAATAVTAVAALGFVSVGIRPPTAEWGVMMTELLPYWREAPFLILQPVACLVLTVLALHLFVGGTRRS
ncbi:ABC transporter permease [Falsiruegeria litorea]|uniref:ABC transporter permease n=1 Tax=Falsiruegeria litorea TaxID=1280831 RepID=UPI001BFD6201|nr:ABC transporter permease [Falsiruegeria litorea]MBT8168334.1 ABC transporter permease [Falsiruegeria litorea]